ncbi:hypothetical protein MRX96_003929 [Rhipicephalus microplus]
MAALTGIGRARFSLLLRWRRLAPGLPLRRREHAARAQHPPSTRGFRPSLQRRRATWAAGHCNPRNRLRRCCQPRRPEGASEAAATPAGLARPFTCQRRPCASATSAGPPLQFLCAAR